MMKNKIYISVLILFVISCTHVPMDSTYQGATSLPLSLKKEYNYFQYNGDYKENIIEETKKYFVNRIEFSDNKIAIEYYDISNNKKSSSISPVIMILPILSGVNSIVKMFARYFAENGFAVVIVHRNNKFKAIKAIDRVDLGLRRIVFDHMQVLDWIKTRKELDAEQIGVFGISMGSIKAALVSALDKRIKASVFALSGGDLPYILSYSTEKGIKKRRLDYLEKNQLTLDQFHTKLNKAITCDPINYAPYIDAKNTLMILALFDRVVPFKKGLELKREIGNPETIYLQALPVSLSWFEEAA